MLTLIVLITISAALCLYLGTTKRYPKGYPPGPTGIPLLGYMPWLAPNSHVQIGKLGRKYGSIFSVQLGSYPFVVLNDLESIKAALKLDVFAGRPNHLLAMSLVKSGLTYHEGPHLVEQRRFVLRTLRDFGFGKNSMDQAAQDEITDLINYFRLQINKPVALREILSISILNVLWTIVAGEKFSFNDPELQSLQKAGAEGFMDPEVQGILYVVPWLAKLFPEITGFNKMKTSAEEVKNTLRESVMEHRRTFVPGSPRDYIDMFLGKMTEATPESSFYENTGIENLVDGLVALLMAGYDTLTATMEFTLLYLIAHPDIQVKLQAEIDHAVGTTRVPNITDRARLPYVEAVMQESMRMSSIAPSAVIHKTMEATDFMGYRLPKGTIILPNLYQVHHNEEYWKDPEVFRPERFINPDGSCRADENVIPFCVGKRACIAESMAMSEYFLFLTNILQTFDLRADPKNPLPPFEARKPALILSPHPYKIVFTGRASRL